MTSDERKAFLRKLDESIKAAKRMSPEEARERLRSEGLCRADGSVAPAYGGKRN